MMGLYKIDNVSREERERREMRRHSIRQWTITILEIGVIVGLVWLLVWAWEWLGI